MVRAAHMTALEKILEFKTIEGFPNYAINCTGQIISLPTERRKYPVFLRGQINKGYLVYSLYKNKKNKPVKAHVAVAEAFICPRPKGKECAHKNGIKLDNRVENLYWATRLQNERDKDRVGGRPVLEDHPSAKLTVKQVYEIKRKYNRESYHKSNAEALAKEYGVHSSTIRNIIRGRYWKSTTQRLTRLASDGKND